MRATAGPSSPSARDAAIPNTGAGALFGRQPCSASYRIRRARGRVHGLQSPAAQPCPRTSPGAAPRRTRRPSHRDPDVLSIDLAGEQFHIAASHGLCLELKTSAANAHPTLSGSGFPMAGAAVCVLHSTEDGAMEMVGVGPCCTSGSTDSRSTPTRYSSRSTEEETPFTLVVTTSWCRTAWRSSPACARPTDDVRWLGVGY